MGRKKQMSYPNVPRYVPKKRGVCPEHLGGCGRPVYKGYVRYKGHYWHTICLVQAVKEGKV
jgi:hypothetical protein